MLAFKKIVIIASLCLFAPISFASISYGDDDTARDDTRSFHLLDDLDMNSSVHFQYAKPKIVIKSIYPELQSEMQPEAIAGLNQLVMDLVKEESRQFKNRVLQYESNQTHIPRAKLKNNFYIDYSSSFGRMGKNYVFSYRFSMQGYIGGMAHPYHYHRVINYDLTKGEEISLSELFSPGDEYLKVLSEYSRETLLRRLQNKNMVMQGTVPTFDNFKNWNLRANGILITFEEYQVAPYVNGAQTVLIPYSILQPYIPSDSLLAGCVAKRKRCMQGNIETGGFIDEI